MPEELPSEEHELHRFLTGILSNDFSLEQKKQILAEYNLGSDEEVVKEVEEMCNLSQDIRQKGIEQGKTEEKNEMIISMHDNGLADDVIATIAKVTIDYVKKVLGSVVTA